MDKWLLEHAPTMRDGVENLEAFSKYRVSRGFAGVYFSFKLGRDLFGG